MLQRLGDSHMAVIPGSVAQSLPSFSDDQESNDDQTNNGKKEEPTPTNPRVRRRQRSDRAGDLGFQVRAVDGGIVVARVDRDGPADRAGVKPGWILEEAEDTPITPLLNPVRTELPTIRGQFVAWELVSDLLVGAPGSTTELRFLNGKNQPVTIHLERRQEPGEPAKIGFLPTLYSRLQSESLQTSNRRTVGLIRFNLWMVPVMQGFDRAVDQFRSADGIIVDLRGNFGGLGGMILGVSGHFFKDRVTLGTLTMRGSELNFFANPRRVNAAGERVEPYSGPVAILTDGLSLSAAEIFAGGKQSVKRARVFGERTGGQALPAVWDRLPNGDILYHAFGDFVTASGTRLEGRGVIPDEVVPLKRADLLEGRDAALNAALDWIARTKGNGSTQPINSQP
jgi:carboxyl-terminal processing protease